MKIKLNILKQLTIYITVVVTVCSHFFLSSPIIYANSTLVLDELTSYFYTGVSPQLGHAFTHNRIFVLKKKWMVRKYFALNQVLLQIVVLETLQKLL